MDKYLFILYCEDNEEVFQFVFTGSLEEAERLLDRMPGQPVWAAFHLMTETELAEVCHE